MRSATTSGVSTAGSPRSRTPKTIVLLGERLEHGRVEARLGRLDEIWSAGQPVELGQERVAR